MFNKELYLQKTKEELIEIIEILLIKVNELQTTIDFVNDIIGVEYDNS